MKEVQNHKECNTLYADLAKMVREMDYEIPHWKTLSDENGKGYEVTTVTIKLRLTSHYRTQSVKGTLGKVLTNLLIKKSRGT